MTVWRFAIDVGGTFTDCVARGPDGSVVTCKVLSSGVTKGCVARVEDEAGAAAAAVAVVDPARAGDPARFWTGYELRLVDDTGRPGPAARVLEFARADGRLVLDRTPARADGRPAAAGDRYELSAGEEAPILAVRRVLGLGRTDPIPPVEVRLGTTRGTNALLTRRGARVGFVTTRGLGDILRIGTQARPRLFDLAIRKPAPLFERVVEIDERVGADGTVLRAPDPVAVRDRLAELRAAGVESLAICLLHGYAHPAHERAVAAVARAAGFADVSVSSEVAPLEKIVWRGDTTVLDAYLSPVLRDYVTGLRRALGAGVLRVLTSAGGLVDGARFVGKDSILSGPAGGVVGYARVASANGCPRAIGFDMGGTSTDVSRFDGRFDLEFETEKAGVRVVAPMMAIETVAAGGGSICAFDGVKLTVGPDSAGADPGPACYGRGGPLTVTDVNVLLGRIPAERFPFPLDTEAARRRLAELERRIAEAPTGCRYSAAELAEGFVEVANANMVRAIRAISVAKGYDPADYTLVSFGGAGGQHACALARELRMTRVLVPRLAGVLSAYGIGVADVRRFREHSVLRPCSEEEIAGPIESIFRELEARTRAEVAAEGVPAACIERPVRSLDLRYLGVEAVIRVPQPAHGTWAEGYERMHEQFYGYRHAGRALEVVAARVEVVGRAAEPAEAPAAEAPAVRRPAPARTTRARFGGAGCEAGVYLREQVAPGDELIGPAILCEPDSTLVVDPGWRAAVRATGDVLLEQEPGPAAPPRVDVSADPVRLEVFNHRFAAIAEQMGLVLQRTASSVNVKERLDFSCALFTATGDLVVNAPHIPVHLGAMGETVRRVVAENPTIRPGDAFVTNDPYRGGSHLPDVTVVMPFHAEGAARPTFFVASRAHHAEIGGIVPGSMPPFSRTLAEEGVVIWNFRILDAGRSRAGALRELLAAAPWPSRAVADNLADIEAQVAANRAGLAGLAELIARHSLPVVEAYTRHIQHAAAEKMRTALRRLVPGCRRFVDHLDDGSPIAVALSVSAEGATIDFTGTGPVLAGNLNANRAIVTAAVLYAFRCLIGEDIPLNAGVLEPLAVVLPPGCLLSPPEHEDPARCAAVVGGNVETSQRVVDVLLGALGVAAASQGTMNNVTFGDETFGYYETICGGSGATAEADGADAVHTHMTNTRLTDPEVLERRCPVRLWRFAIRRGSGGGGRRRGGDGVVRELEFLRPLRVSILSERRGPYPPYAVAGGEPGAFGRNRVVRAGRGEEELPAKVQLEVVAGDRLIVETPGGGGWGEQGRR